MQSDKNGSGRPGGRAVSRTWNSEEGRGGNAFDWRPHSTAREDWTSTTVLSRQSITREVSHLGREYLRVSAVETLGLV